MPNIISHLEFAKEVEARLSDECKKAVEADKHAFLLGSLGPDFLFALREIGSKFGNFANRMHLSNVFKAFEAAAKRLQTVDSPSELSYMMGVTCHYVMDYNLHPIVFYLIEEVLGKDIRAEMQGSIHGLIESAWDTYYIEERGGYPSAAGYDPSEDLVMPDKTLNAIADMYLTTMKDMFGFPDITKRLLKKSFRMTRLFLVLSVDKHGTRKKILTWLEENLHTHKKATPLFRPSEGYGKIDYFNAERHPFYVVRGEPATSTATVYEALEKCLTLAPQYVQAFYDAVKKGTPLNPTLFEVNYEGVRIQ